MTERDINTLFIKWLKARTNTSGAYEAKICKEKSLPFSSVKEHQENALYLANHGIFAYKIPDVGQSLKPFDNIVLSRVPSYVVIFWKQYRGDKRLSLIPIDNWLEEKQRSTRKSIDYERSCEIGKCLEF